MGARIATEARGSKSPGPDDGAQAFVDNHALW